MPDRARGRADTARLDTLIDIVVLGGKSLGFLAIMAGFLVGLRLVAGAL